MVVRDVLRAQQGRQNAVLEVGILLDLEIAVEDEVYFAAGGVRCRNLTVPGSLLSVEILLRAIPHPSLWRPTWSRRTPTLFPRLAAERR